MGCRKEHRQKLAQRSFMFLRPSQVARAFVAFFLAFSLFPVQALADTPQQLTTGSSGSSSAATNKVSNEVIEIGTEPLNLIQNGNYEPASAAAKASTNVTSTGASAPTTAQRNQMLARLNTALMNVDSTSYFGEANWCLVDVSDLQAPLATNATTYARGLVEEVINNNPDIFYAGASYGGGSGNLWTDSGQVTIFTKILVKYYYAPSAIPSMKTKYESAMQNMLSWVNANKSYKNSTDAEKAKAVHDWLVRNVSYNTSAANVGGPKGYGSWDPWSAYGAVVAKTAVCEGYSLAFMAGMKRLGIQASFVTNANHGWNRVRLKVGSSYYWFNIDVTWDDPLPDRGYSNTPRTTYFLKSDNWFKSNNVGSKREHVKWTPAGTASTNTTFDGTWGGGIYPLSSNTHTVTSLSLSPTSLDMDPDSSATLTLKANGTNVVPGMAKWTSSNKSIVTVSANGTVTSGSKTGTATITVTLGGKTARCTVTVQKGIRIDGATVSLASTVTANDLTYKSGVSRKPALKVVLGGKTLTQGTHYTIEWPSDTINPGVKTVTIKGNSNGGYTGSKTFNYTIKGDLNSGVSKKYKGTTLSATGTTSKITVKYNGSAQKIVPTLTFSGSKNYTYTLKEGTDFTVSWVGGVTNAGTYQATITGRGVWKGTWKYSVIISPLNLRDASISYDTTKRYTGVAVTQTPSVTMSGSVVPSSNYSITYKNNVSVGTATMTISGKGANTTGSIYKTFKIVKGANWTRLFGSNALATMAKITQTYGTATTAVVATNAGFKDSLAAAALAGSLGAPMLTTSKGSLSDQTRSELNRMGVRTVYLIGSTSDVSTTTENQIKALSKVTTVKRISAATASAKAIACAKAQPSRSGTVIIATQNNFKDALAISPYAYATKSPILFAETNKTLSATTISYIKSAGFSKAIIVGGPVALPTSIESQLRSAGISAGNITRLAGSNQYKTARVIAEWATGKLKNGTGGSGVYQYASIKFQPAVRMSANKLGVARADDNNIGWKDALAGAALCGKNRSVLLLADAANSAEAATFVKNNKASISSGYVFGGKLAVPEAVYDKLFTASG